MDIEKATSLLSFFVRAHADVLMGRGNQNLLTPTYLFHNSSSDNVQRDIDE